MSPLPMLLADEVACKGVAMADICANCKRYEIFWDADRIVRRADAPAAEWSDSRNAWQCANRLPMEA